jgi:excisionase family DNA binding protein
MKQNESTNTPKNYLTKTDVARMLAVSPRTIDTWMKRGTLPYFRIGTKLVRFDEGDIRTALETSCRVGFPFNPMG